MSTPRHISDRSIPFYFTVKIPPPLVRGVDYGFSNYNKQQLKNCDTRTPRIVSEKEFNNLLKLNQLLVKEMVARKVYLLDSSKPLVVIINEMLENIAINLNLK